MSAQTRRPTPPQVSPRLAPDPQALQAQCRRGKNRQRPPGPFRHRPLSIDRQGCLGHQTGAARLVPSGRVASRRSSWLPRCASRKSARVSTRGSPPACSSTSCTVAWRITNSCCKTSPPPVNRCRRSPDDRQSRRYARPSSAPDFGSAGPRRAGPEIHRQQEPATATANTRSRRKDSRPTDPSRARRTRNSDSTMPPASASDLRVGPTPRLGRRSPAAGEARRFAAQSNTEGATQASSSTSNSAPAGHHPAHAGRCRSSVMGSAQSSHWARRYVKIITAGATVASGLPRIPGPDAALPHRRGPTFWRKPDPTPITGAK